MTRQVVNIGVEGNDGTGDSIREAFSKSNENFQELYAVFGQGGQIGFSSLSDTPNSLVDAGGDGNLVAISSSDGSSMLLKSLEGIGLIIDYTTDPNKIRIINQGAAVSNDIQPALGGDLDGIGLFSVARLAPVTDETATQFNNTHSLTGTSNAITTDDLVIDKAYADQNYANTGKPIPIRDEPSDATEYTLTISAVSGVDATVTAHGLNTGNNGEAYVFDGTSAEGLIDGDTYYIKVVDKNTLRLFASEINALAGNAALTLTTGTITNSKYDSNIPGYYLDDEALPRKHAVKRSGDKMTGNLYLNDHPGSFGGVDSGIEEDYQAATKFYVDNTSFASTTNIFVSTQGSDVQATTSYEKRGRSPSTAFRSVNKAAELAEELIATTRPTTGPYMQTITYNTITPALITAKGLTNGSGYTNMFALLTDNRNFIIEEVVAYVNATFPDFVYDTTICARDVGLMVDSIKLDVESGSVTNFLTIQAGLRYFSSPSGRKAISTQLTETGSAIRHAKLVVNRILQNELHPVTVGNNRTQTVLANPANATARGAVLARFEKILDIIEGDQQGNPPGLESTGPLVEGSTYSIVVDNGGQGYLDQANPANLDLRAGKVIRGKESGALGRIVEIHNAASEDTAEMQLLEPVEFVVGEEIEFGNFIKDQQISIRIESGIYEEQFPIKIPANVSIKGDEFRRVILKPAAGTSTSKWANTYFYRDNTFDGLTLATTGVQDPITGGYYGNHYLTDATKEVNVSNFAKTNVGGYDNAALIVLKNKEFIVEEVIQFIQTTYPSLSYNETKCRRDTGFIVEGIVYDMINGGRQRSLVNQGAYYAGAVSGQETETASAIQHISTLAVNILANASGSPYVALGVTPQVFDPKLTAEANALTSLDALVDLVAYAFNDGFNPPKENSEMDVFLLNDAGIVRNMSVQGHGGFMCTLDPEGQVLTKSPYIQTASSFSQSTNAQRFAGGMFVDAWVGNVPMSIYTNAGTTPFKLYVKTIGLGGLFRRKPQTPAPFYIDGIRYTVNAVTEYDQATGSAILILDPTSGEGTGFTEVIPAFTDPDPNDPTQRTGGFPIYVQTAGNRSMLANDFTQINDDGYGTVATNGALSELVSQFTYYCHTAYYANNGGQIRSLNGSNAYGEYGLVAEGADPNEIPDAVALVDNFVQAAGAYGNGGVQDNPKDQLYIYITGTSYTPHARGELEIDHGGSIGVTRYEVATVENITTGDPLIAGSLAGRDTTVWKINFSTSGQDGKSDTGLKAIVANSTPITLRCNQNFRFDGVRETQPIRPSTAVAFNEYAGIVYRSIEFGAFDGSGVALLESDETVVTIDQTYDYLRLAVKQTEVATANADGNAGTQGATAGDTLIAIELITSPDDIGRLNNNLLTDISLRTVLVAGQSLQPAHILGWAGQVYEVYEYVDRGDYATVKIQRYADQATAQTGATGLGTSLQFSTYDITLRAGLQGKVVTTAADVTTGTITFKISTCRATGHDFLDIGTGSYNDSNYPNVVLGEPVIQGTQDREVQERTEGRVFYVSTDQDGFFRVGRFFTVDQGTGRVTFSASIALSNLDGIGFKRGVAITAFLTDTSMVDNATDVAPTQSAVVGYVNRRLGFTVAGAAVPNALSPFGGFLKLNGGQMSGPINMFDNHIINVPDITPDYNDNTVAVNKAYVDANLEAYNQLTELRDIDIFEPSAGDILMATGLFRVIVDNTINGDWENNIGAALTTSSGSTGTLVDALDTLIRGDAVTVLTYELTSVTQFPPTDTVSYSGGVNAQILSPGGVPVDEFANLALVDGDISIAISRNGPGVKSTATLSIRDAVITNDNIAADAAIEQSKLDMNIAVANSTAPAGTVAVIQAASGLTSFDSTQFNVTTGWASIKDAGVAHTKLANVTTGTVLGRLTGTNGPVEQVTFSDIVDGGLDVTTTGEASKIVKTTAGGKIVAGTDGFEGTKLILDGVTALDFSGTAHRLFSKGGNELISLDGTAITAKGNILASVNSLDIGSATTKFNTVYATSFKGTADNSALLDGVGVTTTGEASKIIKTNTSGGIQVGSHITTSAATGTINIGSSGTKFNTVYATTFDGVATSAKYADLAENYVADAGYVPGTVLVFGGELEVTMTDTKGDPRVAGVVSTNPAHLMNSEAQGEFVVPIALQGRVPVNVVGRVRKGDMLVTSAIPGYATVNNTPGMGQVIGKAVGSKNDDTKGIVEVVVGRV